MTSFTHSSIRRAGAFAALAAVAGCTVAPPSGPGVIAMPGNGKTYEQFLGDDATCRQAASYQVGPGPSAQQSTDAAVGSAVVGTAVGAVAGAAIGSASGNMGGGAAVGGALGLLAGSAVGANNAQASAGNLQMRYDITYSQCMTGHGNTVQAPPQQVQVYTPYPFQPYPYGPYPYGPYYARPHYFYRYW